MTIQCSSGQRGRLGRRVRFIEPERPFMTLSSAPAQTGANTRRPSWSSPAVSSSSSTYQPRHDGLVFVVLFLWTPHLPCSSCRPLSAFHWFVSPPGSAHVQVEVTLTGDAPGSGEAFNVGQFLEETSPYAWASTGIGLCIGLSVLGAGWYVHTSMRPRRAVFTSCPYAGASLSQEPQSLVEVLGRRVSGRRT